MSPVALNLFAEAYENYQKTGRKNFSHLCREHNDLFYSLVAAKQLYEDGYIENVSDFVFQDHISVTPGPITFTLTDSGIEYGRTHREF